MGVASSEDSEIPNLSHFFALVKIGDLFGTPPPRSLKISSRLIGRTLRQGRAAGNMI